MTGAVNWDENECWPDDVCCQVGCRTRQVECLVTLRQKSQHMTAARHNTIVQRFCFLLV